MPNWKVWLKLLYTNNSRFWIGIVIVLSEKLVWFKKYAEYMVIAYYTQNCIQKGVSAIILLYIFIHRKYISKPIIKCIISTKEYWNGAEAWKVTRYGEQIETWYFYQFIWYLARESLTHKKIYLNVNNDGFVRFEYFFL